jgi:hypothetical protein
VDTQKESVSWGFKELLIEGVFFNVYKGIKIRFRK